MLIEKKSSGELYYIQVNQYLKRKKKPILQSLKKKKDIYISCKVQQVTYGYQRKVPILCL